MFICPLFRAKRKKRELPQDKDGATRLSSLPMPEQPRKVLVTRRKLEFFVLRQRLGFDGICPVCRDERHFVSIEEAMSLTGDSMLSIFAAAKAGGVHYIESDSGFLMICETSIELDRTRQIGARQV